MTKTTEPKQPLTLLEIADRQAAAHREAGFDDQDFVLQIDPAQLAPCDAIWFELHERIAAAMMRWGLKPPLLDAVISAAVTAGYAEIEKHALERVESNDDTGGDPGPTTTH